MATIIEYWYIVIPLKLLLWRWIWHKAHSGPRYTSLEELKARHKFGE